MKSIKKICIISLCGVLVSGLFSGCGNSNDTGKTQDGVVTISVSNYPPESAVAERAKFDQLIKNFEEKYQNIKIKPDTYEYKTDTFIPKAASGQIPTLYRTWFTEIGKLIDAGYAADITEVLKKNNYDTEMNDQVKNLVSKNGKLYGVPSDAYCMGLMLNMSLFRQAGLVNEDGTAQFPETYEDLAKAAVIIKEKTGQYGFAIPTTDNCGGWYFMNIAWSFGTQFIQQENGKWISSFDSQECIDALQYLKDLKWKYDVLPSNSLLDLNSAIGIVGADQLAMLFVSSDGHMDDLVTKYSVNKDDLSMVSMPAGPRGRFTQTGGGVYVISPNATPEQTEACMEWLKFNGYTPEVNDDVKSKWETDFKTKLEKNLIVGYKGLQVWDSPNRNQIYNSIMEPLINVNIKLFENYNNKAQVQLRAEEAIKTQELYKVFDALIQEVLTNQNADVSALLKKANTDFQTNYLTNVQ